MIQVTEQTNLLVPNKIKNKLEVQEDHVDLILQPKETILKVNKEFTSLLTVAEQGPSGVPGAQGLTGPQGPTGPAGGPGVGSDANYVHNQILASSVWVINHNLNKYPSVIVVDSGDTVVVGDISYTNLNTITVTFTVAFGGKAFCN